MKWKIIFLNLFLLTLGISVYGQTKQVTINNTTFQIKRATLDNVESGSLETISLYRGKNKLLTHTELKEDGDCSSISVELGTYAINENTIIFYSYWAIADRMPSLLVPFGFRKQIYTVDENGKLTLSAAQIYIEDYLEKTKYNQKFYKENNEWKHIGLEFLTEKPRTAFEKTALQDYVKNIELKYKAKFVVGMEKKNLELEIRKIMKKEIKQHTGDWVDGEIYGNVKK